MADGASGNTVATQIFTDDEVQRAHFLLEVATVRGEPARKLFLRTYSLVKTETWTWYAMPEEEWPLLATILPNRIIMQPIHVNPYAQRYLKPKNGRFSGPPEGPVCIPKLFWETANPVLQSGDAESATSIVWSADSRLMDIIPTFGP